jgi:hypothetical protein
VTGVLEQLAAPFPKHIEASLKKGGVALTFIPISAVISRTNEVLGLHWSYTVQSTQVVDGWIIAHVRVVLAQPEQWPGGDKPVEQWAESTRDGFGGQEIKHRRDGQILDMSHDFKGAVSDALKKALQAFGVGLYLATHDESLSTTFDDKAAGAAAAVVQQVPDLRGDPAPAVVSDIQASLKALAARGKKLGLSNADIRDMAAQVLGRVIAKASDIATFDDIEKVEQRFDELEAILKEEVPA